LNQEQLTPSLQHLVEQLAGIPGVVAVSLGGSRACGQARPDSDWDFGLYYRKHINADHLRVLGLPGHIVEPGTWGRLVNGGGWLLIDGQRVDVLYRDLSAVEHWVKEAQQGRFEVDNVAGLIIGLPTYVLAGELAMGKVLYGTLPRPAFPEALRGTAPAWWEGNAAFSLFFADSYAARNETTACAGSLARAVMAMAHARLARRGVWALNEKRIVELADLAGAEEILARLGKGPEELMETTGRMRQLLGLARPHGLKADEVVRSQT
jgi:predicted nucleotidyltransferase